MFLILTNSFSQVLQKNFLDCSWAFNVLSSTWLTGSSMVITVVAYNSFQDEQTNLNDFLIQRRDSHDNDKSKSFVTSPGLPRSLTLKLQLTGQGVRSQHERHTVVIELLKASEVVTFPLFPVMANVFFHVYVPLEVLIFQVTKTVRQLVLFDKSE